MLACEHDDEDEDNDKADDPFLSEDGGELGTNELVVNNDEDIA